MPRLFHFSDDPAIARFEPRPVRTPSERGEGRAWLNGPLVWAIEEARQGMYLFPRDCPRILVWPTPATTPADRAAWWGLRECRMIAHIEWAWFERLRTGRLWRYELPAERFDSLDDAGMWVSREAVTPISVVCLDDLPLALREADVELRLMERLTPLANIWDTSLHASGVRLRNAIGWKLGPGVVRPARLEDAERMPAVEDSAGALFRTAPGLEWVAEGDNMSAETHRPFIEAGTSFVVEAEGGALTGFVACEAIGDVLHVWELAVGAEAQGRGLGRRLMNAARACAEARGLSALTLSTFRDVAWNAPFYERLGYRVLEEAELDDRLRGILRHEADVGLPADRRCAMRLELPR